MMVVTHSLRKTKHHWVLEIKQSVNTTLTTSMHHHIPLLIARSAPAVNSKVSNWGWSTIWCYRGRTLGAELRMHVLYKENRTISFRTDIQKTKTFFSSDTHFLNALLSSLPMRYELWESINCVAKKSYI